MISHHQSQPATVTGYFQYLSQNQARVNVGPHEGADNDEVMTETTTETITPSSDETVMNNDNNNSASGINVSSSENAQAQETSSVKDKDVTVWSSSDVKQWVDEQCQKFELKTTTTDKFQMNGQALILLTKHDFLRRSPDGGEILYYALQRLINPHKSNSIRTNRNSMRNGSWRHSTRIVEIGSDTDEHNSSVGSPSSSKPIVEEPDDPPLYRRSDSDIFHENHPYQHYPHSFLHSHSHMRPPIFTMPNAAYYHQQQVYPNAYMYAHHMHPQMSQQQYFHPHQHAHFAHQYHPMMGAQGVVIEVIDNDEAKNYANNGVHSSSNDNSTNGAANTDTQEQLFMVTINGQRYVMNEEQVNSYVTEVQRQQQQQQQQQFQQQQQQHFHHHQQQPQQPQQQPQQPQQQQQFHQHQQPPPPPSQFHQQQQQQRQPPPSQFHQHQQQQQPFAYQQRQTSQDPLFHPT